MNGFQGNLKLESVLNAKVPIGIGKRNWRFKDLSGLSFGKLFVIKIAKNNQKSIRWICKCSCGNLKEVRSSHLTTNKIRSCGCLHKETVTKHGWAGTSEYKAWHAALKRCTNINNPMYKNYGKRGISICKRWLSFNAFLLDMGAKPFPYYTLERIDNNKGYSSENCKWATRKEQQNNTRKTIFITFENKTQTISQWAQELGLKPYIIYQRYKKKQIINIPLRYRKDRKY